MELMDLFNKLDNALTQSCNRAEKTYMDMAKTLSKNPELKIEKEQARGRPQTVTVQEYLKDFHWDQVRFQRDKPLKIIGQKIQGTQKACDDRLKKLNDE